MTLRELFDEGSFMACANGRYFYVHAFENDLCIMWHILALRLEHELDEETERIEK